MPRKVSLPGAAELFRTTHQNAPAPLPAPAGATSGRVRHDEKITVYISAEELVSLEQARLRLRAEFGIGVDRGRIVREAVASALADLSENGAASHLAQQLRQDA